MKVTAIRLVNFMAFEDTGWIELRPITLLFGRNSSGKSAIIRALLLLKQSLDAEGEERPLAFVKEDGLVDLGDFQTTVHRKPGEGSGESQRKDHLERSIVFGFRCDLTGDPILDRMRELSREDQGSLSCAELLTCAELLIGFGWYDKSVKPDLLRLQVVDLKATVSPVVLLECGRLRESDVAGLDVQSSFILNSNVVQNPELDEQVIGLPWRGERGFWTSFADPMPQPFEKLDAILKDVQDGVTLFLQKIVHIGPIRPRPERIYVIRDIDQPHFEREGLRGWYNFLRDRLERADQADLIDEWMRRLDLASEVRAIADKDNKPIARSQVLVNDKVESVNIKDIGFGASQVLPVIIAAVLAEPDSLVIIEQPELHLHTSAQVELMDLFTQSLRNGARFLVETHSEHMLLRLQRDIAEELLRSKSENTITSVNNNQVVILFTTRDKEKGLSNSEIIFLHKDGQIPNESSEAFRDFFRQDYDEVNAILEFQIKLRSS